jgi:hypothetical protein
MIEQAEADTSQADMVSTTSERWYWQTIRMSRECIRLDPIRRSHNPCHMASTMQRLESIGMFQPSKADMQSNH